jgi:hypothetical protein
VGYTREIRARTFDATRSGGAHAKQLTRDHVCMAQSNNRTITDPQAMRAMAHPARIEIVEHLASTGAVVTATGAT